MAGINNLSGMSDMSSLLSSMTGTSGTSNANKNNPLSTLFGNSGNSSNTGMMGIDFSNYSSIKSGSYYKLLKKYYSSNTKDNTSDDIKAYQAKVDRMADASAALSYSLNEVIHGDFSSDKREDLLKDVEKFVEDYNTTVTRAGNSDSKSVLQKAKWMTSMTREYSNILSEVGISVGTDNKLTLNKEEFNKADSNTLQSVFGTDPNSFSNKVLYKAEQLYSLSKTYGSSATAYTSAGTYKPDTATTTANVVDALL